MTDLVKFKSTGFSGSVDSQKRIIEGLTLIEANREALGHGMYIDETMIDQVVAGGLEFGELGAKARYDHPDACFSSMGDQLGRLKNFRREGNKAVADLHIGEYTKKSPKGDVGEHVLAMANEDPDIVGMSIVFTTDEPEMFEAGEGEDENDLRFKLPHARVKSFHGADVVDEGAATDGLFNRPRYLAEQAQLWLSERSGLVKEVLSPIVKEMVTELNDNNKNQNQSNMSEKKASFSDKLGDLIEKHFSKSEEVEVAEVTETNEELEAATTALAEKDAEIEALKAEVEASKEQSEKVASESKELFNSIKAELEALKSEPIGSVVEPVSTDDTSVELSEEAKKEQRELAKDDQIAKWGLDQAAGITASKEYIKNNQ